MEDHFSNKGTKTRPNNDNFEGRFASKAAVLGSNTEDNLDNNSDASHQLSIDGSLSVGDDDEGDGVDKPGGAPGARGQQQQYQQHRQPQRRRQQLQTIERPKKGKSRSSKRSSRSTGKNLDMDDDDNSDEGEEWEEQLDGFEWIEDSGPDLLASLIERQADILSAMFLEDDHHNDKSSQEDREEEQANLEAAIMDLEEEINQIETHLDQLLDAIAESAQLSIWKPDEMETLRQLTIQGQMQLLQYDLMHREISLYLPRDDDQANDILLVELAVIEQPVPVPLQIMGSSSPHAQYPALGLEDIQDHFNDHTRDNDENDVVMGDGSHHNRLNRLNSNTRSISTDSSSTSGGSFIDFEAQFADSDELLDDEDFFSDDEFLRFDGDSEDSTSAAAAATVNSLQNFDSLEDDSMDDGKADQASASASTSTFGGLKSFLATKNTKTSLDDDVEVGISAANSHHQSSTHTYSARPREIGPQSKMQSKEWEDYVVQIISSPLCPFTIIGSVQAFLIVEDEEQGCFVESEPLAEAAVDPETGVAVFRHLQADVQRFGLEYLTAVTTERPQFVQLGFAVEVEIEENGVYRVCSNLEQSYPCRFYTTDEEWLDAAGDMIWLNAVNFDQNAQTTSWIQLVNSLQLHFLAQTFQDPLHPARALSLQDLEYLRSKFMPDQDQDQMDVIQFLGRELRDLFWNPDDHQDQPLAMWQWFGRIVEMMRFKPNLQAMWCQGILFGLVSRADATDSLTGFDNPENDAIIRNRNHNNANANGNDAPLIGFNNQQLDGIEPGPGSCLIRFSERYPGSLVVVYLDSEDGRSSSSFSNSRSSSSSNSTMSSNNTSTSNNVVVKNCLITQDMMDNDETLADLLSQYPQFQSVLTVDPADVLQLDHRPSQEVFASAQNAYIETHSVTTVISHQSASGTRGYIQQGKFRGLINFEDLQYIDHNSSSSSSSSSQVTDIDSDGDDDLSSRLALLTLTDDNKIGQDEHSTDSIHNTNNNGSNDLAPTKSEQERLVIVRMIPLHSTLSERVKMQLASEANMLATINHDNVAKFYGFSVDPMNHVRLVHDFDQNRHHLNDVMFNRHLNLVEIVVIAKGVASGMRCLVDSCFPLHHGDLSAENVMLDEESLDVKICDYGRSRANRLRYRAPEVLKGDRATPMTDVYSFAMMLAEMLNQHVVFDNLDDFDAANAATYSGVRPEIDQDVPASLETLLHACWSATPLDRPSFADLEDFLDTLLQENIVNENGVDLERELTLAEWQLYNAERQRRDAQNRLMYANNQRLAFRRMVDNINTQLDMSSRNITDLEEDLLDYLASFEIEYDELQNLQILEDREFDVIKSGVWRGTPVTIKEIKEDIVNDEMVNTFYLEISRMSKLRHKNLVLFMGACLKDRLCIVTERLDDHMNLFDLVHDKLDCGFNEESMAHILSGVVRGLQHMHLSKPEFVAGVVLSHNVHLKLPLNWTSFQQAVVKLDPFVTEHVMMEHARAVGDDNYLGGLEPFVRHMAPEMVLAMEQGLGQLSETVDVFSLGTLIWELLTGAIPYSRLDEQQVSERILNDERPELPEAINERLERVINACWDADERKRPTDEQLLEQFSQLNLNEKQ